MASSVSQIEEIPRNDFTVPQIRLKIIDLHLNERGESLTPPIPQFERENGESRKYQQQLVVKKHQLLSFDHLLHDLPLVRLHHKRNQNQFQQSPFSPSNNQEHRSFQQSPFSPHTRPRKSTRGGDAKGPEGDSVFVVFVKGMNNLLKGDKEQIKKNIVELLNKHAVAVLRKEHQLFNRKDKPSESFINDFMVHGALLALNELLDQGVFDITRLGMVQTGQVLTFTLYFRHNLAHLGRTAWQSSYTQVFRDAWMSFGCLGAMFLISTMRH